jgi:hypothetical protein
VARRLQHGGTQRKSEALPVVRLTVGRVIGAGNFQITPNKLTWRCGWNATTTKCEQALYNSMGYLMLGLVLAQHANLSSWDQLDQKAAALPATAINGTRSVLELPKLTKWACLHSMTLVRM